jgi:hypothetical protein
MCTRGAVPDGPFSAAIDVAYRPDGQPSLPCPCPSPNPTLAFGSAPACRLLSFPIPKLVVTNFREFAHRPLPARRPHQRSTTSHTSSSTFLVMCVAESDHDLHPDTLADSDNLKAKPLVLEGLAPVQPAGVRELRRRAPRCPYARRDPLPFQQLSRAGSALTDPLGVLARTSSPAEKANPSKGRRVSQRTGGNTSVGRIPLMG